MVLTSVAQVLPSQRKFESVSFQNKAVPFFPAVKTWMKKQPTCGKGSRSRSGAPPTTQEADRYPTDWPFPAKTIPPTNKTVSAPTLTAPLAIYGQSKGKPHPSFLHRHQWIEIGSLVRVIVSHCGGPILSMETQPVLIGP